MNVYLSDRVLGVRMLAFGGYVDMELLVYLLAALIGLVALFALLRLFSISNDLKAIREDVRSIRENAGSQSTSQASNARAGSGPLGL